MSPTLLLHDTLLRRKTPFVPRDPARVSLYVCGPTVYNFAHIGNARPVVVFDVLFRLLRRLYGDAAVIYARNITDVDDKISQAAVEEGVGIGVIAERYAAIYQSDMAALGALTPSIEPRATDHIGAMIDQISRLIAAGAAYAAEGHVLFRVGAFADYGALSGRSLDDMIAGARVEIAPYKEAPADFVLWKPSKPDEPVWDSPFGPGRPGWHIECSAMVEDRLGLPVDIHGGGHDLIFPHHENERAQAQAATGGSQYARYWVHNGFLDFSGEKMSKSLGNVMLVHDLLARRSGETLRWALLKAHYRSPLDWTEGLIDQSEKELDYLYGVLSRATDVAVAAPDEGAETEVLEPLLDDLNTPQAQAKLHALARRLEQEEGSQASATKRDLLDLAGTMGVLTSAPNAWFERGADQDLKGRIEDLVRRRDQARRDKDFAAADGLRAELDALKVVVMDGPEGAIWRMREG
jgi:cysteinyl-tRNA synthetase